MHLAEFKLANEVLVEQFPKTEMDRNDKTQHNQAKSAADMNQTYGLDAL